ncbi:putative serine/threonine protein kinase [Chytridiales sp. JEL 0842]|nr:putative serine/threonine protein kinase [Chytridiales sp. JEL 0842]
MLLKTILRTIIVTLSVALIPSVSSAPTPASNPLPPAPPNSNLTEVLFVGNNWEGTASVIQSTFPFTTLGKLNMVPDKKERLDEIYWNPVKLVAFLGIRTLSGEGNDQMVDDLYTTLDGQFVVASRPSFADVVSISLTTGKVNWRFPVSGFRSDHMAVSPDGLKVAVSASLTKTVHVLDIYTGKELGKFKTGDKPHENFFTEGGRYIWNMAIGNVESGLDNPITDFTKGDRKITIADTFDSYKVVKTINMRDRLDAFGPRGAELSNAIRPAAFTPDEKTLYFQVSFFNGIIEYDIPSDTITRIQTLPEDPNLNPDRSTWLLDSRHHGLTMNPSGTKLCVAGTMDGYATVVDRPTLKNMGLVPASKPYWATVSGDGKHCVVSEAKGDKVTAIDFETGEKVAEVGVGLHPQRVRIGRVPSGWVSPSIF